MGFLSFLGGIFAPITALINQAAQKQQAQFNLQMAQIQAATDLAKTETTNDFNSLVARLGSTDKGFKDITFFLLMLPILITCISPTTGAAIFTNLNTIPSYYQNLVLCVYGAIWGLKNVVMPLSAHSVTRKLIDKAEFFKELRQAEGKALDSGTVATLDKVLDDVEGSVADTVTKDL